MTDTISGATIVGFNPIVLRGADGVSITDAAVNGDGALVLTLSDGNNVTAGAGLLTGTNARAFLDSAYVPHQATAPTDPSTAPAYFDTTTLPPVLRAWTGSAWAAVLGATIDDSNVSTGTAYSSSKQAATFANLTGVQQVLTPEMFADDSHTTFDQRMNAALAYATTNGGGRNGPGMKIVGQRGVNYTHAAPINDYDFYAGCPIELDFSRSTWTYTGTGQAWRAYQSDTSNSFMDTLTINGGRFISTTASQFFAFDNLNNIKMPRRAILNVPSNIGIRIRNDASVITGAGGGFSERNEFRVRDIQCKHVLQFESINGGDPSVAGTYIDAYLQGGTVGEPKIYVVPGSVSGGVSPSLYDSEVHIRRGNIVAQGVCMNLAGSMRGTKIFINGVEQPTVGDTGFYFRVDDIASAGGFPGFPLLVGGAPPCTANRMAMWYGGTTPSPTPFNNTWLPGGTQHAGPDIRHKLASILSVDGPLSFTVSNGFLAFCSLQANLTGLTIIGAPAVPEFGGISPTQLFVLAIQQDATGGRTYAATLSATANLRFAGGSPPSDTTPNSTTYITFIWENGTSKWNEISRSVAVR